jgi:hypothetical protein
MAAHAHQNGLDLQIDGSIAERVLGRTPDLFDFKLQGEPQLLLSSYSPSATQIERMLWRTQLIRTLSKNISNLYANFIQNSAILSALSILI